MIPRKLFFVLVVVVVFVLGVLAGGVRCDRDNALEAISGFWTAPSNFCEKAGLASMTMMIDQPKKGKRLGYLSITRDDGAVVCNQPIEISTNASWMKGKHNAVTGSFEIKHQKNPAWPEKAKFAYARGRLQIYDKDTTFAVLHRDGEASSLIYPEAPLE